MTNSIENKLVEALIYTQTHTKSNKPFNKCFHLFYFTFSIGSISPTQVQFGDTVELINRQQLLGNLTWNGNVQQATVSVPNWGQSGILQFDGQTNYSTVMSSTAVGANQLDNLRMANANQLTQYGMYMIHYQTI